MNNEEKEKLKTILHSKIGEKRVQRGSKQYKEKIMNDTFKNAGIDKEKFYEELERVKKSGMQIDMKK